MQNKFAIYVKVMCDIVGLPKVAAVVKNYLVYFYVMYKDVQICFVKESESLADCSVTVPVFG